jgi:hypothetical protein
MTLDKAGFVVCFLLGFTGAVAALHAEEEGFEPLFSKDGPAEGFTVRAWKPGTT